MKLKGKIIQTGIVTDEQPDPEKSYITIECEKSDVRGLAGNIVHQDCEIVIGENIGISDDAKTLYEIKKRLHHAGYKDSKNLAQDVGLLIYERDAANHEVNHLKKEIDKLADVDRIREIDQKDEEIEELKESIECMKRNERNWKEEWKSEVAMLNATIKELNNDNA